MIRVQWTLCCVPVRQVYGLLGQIDRDQSRRQEQSWQFPSNMAMFKRKCSLIPETSWRSGNGRCDSLSVSNKRERGQPNFWDTEQKAEWRRCIWRDRAHTHEKLVRSNDEKLTMKGVITCLTPLPIKHDASKERNRFTESTECVNAWGKIYPSLE